MYSSARASRASRIQKIKDKGEKEKGPPEFPQHFSKSTSNPITTDTIKEKYSNSLPSQTETSSKSIKMKKKNM